VSDILSGYIFYEIAALLVLAAGIGFIGLKLRQPLVVSFIAVGIIAGQSGLDMVHSAESIGLLSELGIAVLLFLVGLKLDIGLIRNLGPAALIIGLGQIILTLAGGFGLAMLIGFSQLDALLIAVGLCFSSTIIIVKLLSDKREIESLHGRIALGVLIVQDIIVVIAIIILTGLSSTDSGIVGGLIGILWPAGLMLFGVWAFIRMIANRLTKQLAQTPELLLCFAIGWAALLASLGHYLGLGKELGGLLAGICFASTPYREAIAARLASLRDFLLLFFFISLGTQFNLHDAADVTLPASLLIIFVLLGKPLLVYVLTSRHHYERRTRLLASITLGQISEFSLIFLGLAIKLGATSQEVLDVMMLVALASIAISSSMITYSHKLVEFLESLMIKSGGATKTTELGASPALLKKADVIIFGLGRYGLAVARTLQAQGLRVMGIDFNPTAIGYAGDVGIKCIFGDATDREFLSSMPLDSANWIISATPDHEQDAAHEDPRLLLLHNLQSRAFAGRIAVTAQTEETAIAMGDAGADLVLMPYRDAAHQAAEMVAGTPNNTMPEMLAPDGQSDLL